MNTSKPVLVNNRGEVLLVVVLSIEPQRKSKTLPDDLGGGGGGILRTVFDNAGPNGDATDSVGISLNCCAASNSMS